MSRPYRHTTPVQPKAATGRVAAVYAQMEQDFLLADGPLMSLSPAPELLAATWALLREAEIVGTAGRAAKEAVASAVSLANRCPFCTEAHALLAHGAGDHGLAEAARAGHAPDDRRHAALLAWAGATRSPGDPALAAPPFPAAQAPEFLGTALVTHFINRMVTSLLDEDALLPSAVRRSAYVRRAAALTVGRAARRRPEPGAGLDVLDGLDLLDGVGGVDGVDAPAWAGPGPIGRAYGTLAATASAGGGLLGLSARAAVLAAVAAWDGAHPALGGDPVAAALGDVPPAERPAARLALLAALAPYRITDADVAAWRQVGGGGGDGGGRDGELTRVLAFGAITATVRVEGWLTDNS
ncbi:DNA-binding protein [Kitasatospora sp. NPDC093806]|uniref:DNA-binding protein n=1 Tax=Kitasatospora sp. NPDC093806 TaxID=3155075 RepID=UPI003429EC89